MALSQNTLKKIQRLFFPPKDVNAMLKSILVPTANGKPQTASSRLPFAVNAMLKVPILERPSWKLPSALSENCVSIFIYFCINICFCIKQANKICTLLSSHLLALIVFSVQCFCFTKAYMFLVTHPDTNPAGEG